jgi:hypothetical protein
LFFLSAPFSPRPTYKVGGTYREAASRSTTLPRLAHNLGFIASFYAARFIFATLYIETYM